MSDKINSIFQVKNNTRSAFSRQVYIRWSNTVFHDVVILLYHGSKEEGEEKVRHLLNIQQNTTQFDNQLETDSILLRPTDGLTKFDNQLSEHSCQITEILPYLRSRNQG